MPKFQDKPTVATNDLSNTTAYFPMVQSGLNKKATTTQIKRDAVANCSTAAGTIAKTATIRNMPDFELLSGIVVTVAFSNTNTAESPTLNINNTGAWPIKLENQASNVTIGNGCWVAGAILEFKYIEVSDTEKYWLLVGHNVAQQTSEYTIMSDGKIEQWIKEPISITNYNDNWQTIPYPIPFSKIDSIQIQLYGSGYSQSYVPMIYNTNLDSCKFNVRVAQLESKPQTVYIHAIGRI